MKNIVRAYLYRAAELTCRRLSTPKSPKDSAEEKSPALLRQSPMPYALTRAADNGIRRQAALARRDYADVAAYSKAMADALKEEQADLVIYAGFMTILDEQVCDARPGIR